MTNDEKEQIFRNVLAEIRNDISLGKYDEATNKLGAISFRCPSGSTHSNEIGNLYWELGFPAMAGRYWYLFENKTVQMLAACDEFQRSLGNNPVLIVESLGWPADPSPDVKAKLEELHGRARDFRKKYSWKIEATKGIRDRFALLGCGIIATIILFIFIQGIIFIGTWFRQ
ncbi:MAG: hypothetical protein IT426_14340 [Pirellulales bacterium]|nr:hypothetical protein [Pirellulales bacterium]